MAEVVVRTFRTTYVDFLCDASFLFDVRFFPLAAVFAVAGGDLGSWLVDSCGKLLTDSSSAATGSELLSLASKPPTTRCSAMRF